jgi:hypothetical protein
VLVHGAGTFVEYYSGSELLNQGILQADADYEKLTLNVDWINEGVFSAIGNAILSKRNLDEDPYDPHDDFFNLCGSGAAFSGAEAAISWAGFTSDEGWTYVCEGSFTGDEEDYFTIAECEATEWTVMLSGLSPNTSYYLRVVATDGTATEIYDAGMVSTANVADPNVPDDTAGWYRVAGMHLAANYSDGDLSPGDRLPADPDSTAYIVNPNSPVELPGVVIQVFGASGPPEMGSFKEDTSWLHAGSSQAALLQAVQGLATDGSLPIIDETGCITVWHVESVYVHDSYVSSEDKGYTFDVGRYPAGGYSASYRYDKCTPYTISLQQM